LVHLSPAKIPIGTGVGHEDALEVPLAAPAALRPAAATRDGGVAEGCAEAGRGRLREVGSYHWGYHGDLIDI